MTIKFTILFLSLWAVFILFANAENEQNPEEIVKECIKRHGGWEKFSAIQDIYAKMKVHTFSEQGDVESTFHEYYRLPDKLRIEMYPPMDPPVIVGWDGKDVWEFAKGNLEKTDKKEQVDRIYESLRFVKLIILTNLLNKGSSLKYEAYQAKKNVGIHVISQTDGEGEKIWLYISDKTFTLLGAEFTFRGNETLFEVIFTKHKEIDGMYLPRETKLYREKKLVMEAKLSLVKINALQNGNSFFSNLKENPDIKKAETHYRKTE